MKKIASLVLALTMLFCTFVLTSCDSNSGSNVEQSNSSNVEQSNTQKEKEFYNLVDETKDLLARAGYALSPCDKRDIIFSFFIEREVFDMIEIDIALEEHGLPCFIE